MSKRVHSIDEMNSDVLWCRTFGHSWTNYARAEKGSGKGYSFMLKCRKCGTLKEILALLEAGILTFEETEK